MLVLSCVLMVLVYTADKTGQSGINYAPAGECLRCKFARDAYARKTPTATHAVFSGCFRRVRDSRTRPRLPSETTRTVGDRPGLFSTAFRAPFSPVCRASDAVGFSRGNFSRRSPISVTFDWSRPTDVFRVEKKTIDLGGEISA